MGRKWVNRVWTYQEILLASNPIVVCGNVHIPWGRFASSITFLGCNFGTSYDSRLQTRDWNLPVWLKLVSAKERLPAGYEIPPQLARATARPYAIFLSRIRSIERGITLSVDTIAIFCAVTLLAMGWYIMEGLNDFGGAEIIVISSFVFLPITLLSHVIVRLFALPTLRFPEHLAMREDDLVDGICSREARDPKDKGYAVRAVMQRLLNRELSLPNYQASVEAIYMELSLHLIEATNSLNLLLPAALSSSAERPSWVPDWGQKVPEFWKEHQLRQGSLSQGCWRWDPIKSGILVVRARLLETVAACFRFEETSDVFRANERETHSQNHRTSRNSSDNANIGDKR